MKLALMLRDLLAGEGLQFDRLHVFALMKRMGFETLCRKLNTSKPEPGHKIYPYLLRSSGDTTQIFQCISSTCCSFPDGRVLTYAVYNASS